MDAKLDVSKVPATTALPSSVMNARRFVGAPSSDFNVLA
jgi:hypothetical protein